MTETLATTADSEAATRRRWSPPEDQPAYVRPALLAVAIVAAVLFAWGINHADYHAFYANAARSMTENWKAFFFGSFDPANSITVDKIPGFLWPQAISARIFGFHPWSIILPQVLEGVGCVLVLYLVVRRWAGAHAGLLASVAMLVTPVVVGLFRTGVEDPMFTLCALLAAEATQRAALRGRLRPLVLAGVWVGIGFQAKMLESWAVLPALAVVYLVTAPVSTRRRLVHVAVAGLVTVVVSASWVIAVTLTPAGDRPYIDGTTNNSALSMVVGYNFLSRFSMLNLSPGSFGSVTGSKSLIGGSAPPQGGKGGQAGQTGHGQGAAGGSGSVPSSTGGAPAGAAASSSGGPPASASASSSGGAPAGAAASAHGAAGQGSQSQGGQVTDASGWAKMFQQPLVSQVGWLYPLAAIALLFGLVRRRGKPRTDVSRAGFLLWGIWLVTYFLVFSAGSVAGHTYYMGVIAVPLAALVGGGTIEMWREFRSGGKGAWVLPVALAATAAWSAYQSSRFPSFQPWLEPTAIVVGAAAVALLALALLRGLRPAVGGLRITTVALLAGVVAVLIAPAAWASSVLSPSYHYTMVGGVGPTATDSSVASFLDTPGTPNAQERRIFTYTKAHQGSAVYTLATTSWLTSYPFILTHGTSVLSMGGFTSDAPYPTLPQFQQLVNSGKLRFLLTGGAPNFGTAFGASLATNTSNSITAWARTHCVPVPARYYGGVPQSSIPASSPNPFAVMPLALYECSPLH